LNSRLPVFRADATDFLVDEVEGAGLAVTVTDDPVERGWLSATLANIAPLSPKRQSGLSAFL
jgi:hypothetical protein